MLALRQHRGAMANCDLTAYQPICPLANGRADQAKGSLRKVPWVLSLSGVLLVLFFRQGKKSTEETMWEFSNELPDKPKFERILLLWDYSQEHDILVSVIDHGMRASLGTVVTQAEFNALFRAVQNHFARA